MLPATLKLCCGISQEHLRKLTGLQRTAVGAFGKEISKFKLALSLFNFQDISYSMQRTFSWTFRKNLSTSYEEKGFSTLQMNYMSQAESTLHNALSILNQQEGWKTELHQGNGDWILSKKVQNIGKVFRAEAVIDSPPEHIYTLLFEKIEQMDEWNPGISKVQILQKIGSNTLLTREVTSEISKNIISQRDFVSVRHCCRKGASFFLTGTSTDSELMPPQRGIIRGEAGLTFIVLQPLDADDKKTHLTWILSIDLKGWVPRAVSDQALSKSQVDFIAHLRNHLSFSEKKDLLPAE
ncbi:steroidogenic acute regulatory protein, mitochondrial [Xenopus laevis]|uniref:START domain-containing protein 1 n=2 Tax=Xenopus laevis TaxID=8355 RepID=A0A974CEV3_XENLA|nr:steroidogenic acute regulatory protein, mitochondrial [Xenopus laevis]OCT71948.1 hypothetical protein XELAEV_18034925mg [Xenopus laevis]